jgi:O-antigen/teichoic acid export membrane protein
MSERSTAPFAKLFRSSGVLLLGMAFHLVVGLLAKVVIARLLGKTGYGGVTIGITLLTTASILVVVGIDTGVGRFLPRYDDAEQRRGVLVSAFQLVVPFSLLTGLIIALLAGPIARYAFHSPWLETVIRAFGLTIPLAALVRLTMGSVRGMQQSVPRICIQNIALPSARLASVALALVLGFRSVGVAWAYAAAYSVATAISLYYLVRHTPLVGRGNAVSMHRELLVFSAPVVVTATMNLVFSNIDIFMLGYFSQSTGDVGVYNSVYPLATLLSNALTVFGFLFMPIISELHSNGELDQMRRVYQVVSKWILFSTLPLFLTLAFYPEVVIGLTFGSEYKIGGLALTLLAIGFFTHAIAGPSGDALTALGRTRLVMYDNLSVAAVNVALNVVLIPRYSYVGAAIATTVGYVLMNTLYIVQLYREIGTHPFRGTLLRPGLVAALLWICLYGGVRVFSAITLPVFIAVMTVFLPLYVIVVLRFGGVEPEERSLFGTFEERIGFKLEAVRAVARRLAG